MWRECPLRGAGHLCLQGRLALGAAARAGPGDSGPERRNHLLNGAHLHLHAGARPPPALLGRRGHPALTQHHLVLAGVIVLALVVTGGSGGRSGDVRRSRLRDAGDVLAGVSAWWCVLRLALRLTRLGGLFCMRVGPLPHSARHYSCITVPLQTRRHQEHLRTKVEGRPWA